MPVLDEQALRKETFRDGTAVKLADGQEWTFPEPLVRFLPCRHDDGSWYFGGGRKTYTPDYETLLSTLAEAEGTHERYNALLGLAVLILEQNYTLDPEQVVTLLPMEQNNPANVEMWNALFDVVTGDGAGKRSAGG